MIAGWMEEEMGAAVLRGDLFHEEAMALRAERDAALAEVEQLHTEREHWQAFAANDWPGEVARLRTWIVEAGEALHDLLEWFPRDESDLDNIGRIALFSEAVDNARAVLAKLPVSEPTETPGA